MASNPQIDQANFIESCLYCLDRFKPGIPPNVLLACEPYLQHEMTIANEIVIAGIYAKNRQLTKLFYKLVAQLDSYTVE